MAWIAENRQYVQVDDGSPVLTDKLKTHLREKYFPRYPTKRAVLLPALHAIQHEYNYIPPKAFDELAEFLDCSAGEVMDTASFYEEYWLRPKGKYLLQVCRSLACHLCGQKSLTDTIRGKLGIDEFETTEDGKFTLVELECLGACGTAPVVMVNEVLHEEMTVEKLNQILDALPDDPHDYHDPSIQWKQDH